MRMHQQMTNQRRNNRSPFDLVSLRRRLGIGFRAAVDEEEVEHNEPSRDIERPGERSEEGLSNQTSGDDNSE